MGAAVLPVILLLVLLAISWQMLYTANRDLIRVKAWGYLTRKMLPFIVLTLMALSLFAVRSFNERWIFSTWLVVFAVAVILSNLFATSTTERRANRAFRRKNYIEATAHYRALAEHESLARHYAFLSAALGASEYYEDSLDAATQAINRDPRYGLAYYNRALVERKLGHQGRAIKDLRRALEADLPRRIRPGVENLLEEMT